MMSVWNKGLWCVCCAIVVVNGVSLWNEGLWCVCCAIVVVNDVSLWNEGLWSVCCTVVLVNDVSLWNEGLCCVYSRSMTRSLRECPVSSVTLSSANPPRAGMTPHRWWVAVLCWSCPTQPPHAAHYITFSCVKRNVSIQFSLNSCRLSCWWSCHWFGGSCCSLWKWVWVFRWLTSL